MLVSLPLPLHLSKNTLYHLTPPARGFHITIQTKPSLCNIDSHNARIHLTTLKIGLGGLHPVIVARRTGL